MQAIVKWYVKAQNWQHGQTMTEYALILAAVGVIVYHHQHATGHHRHEPLSRTARFRLSTRRRSRGERAADA